MALIRSTSAAQHVRDAIVLDFGDLHRQGAAMLDHARAEAAKIVAEAKAERERIIAGGFEQGKAAGLAQGMQEGRKLGEDKARQETLAARQQELAGLIQAWGAALQAFSTQRDVFVQAAERDVIRLACVIAQRVVKRHVELNPDAVIDQVRAVLGTVIRPTEAVLAINPEDRGLVETALGGLIAQFPAMKSVSLVDDAGLARGSCVARMRDPETAGLGGGEVDASIATQVDRIVSVLLPGEVERK